jgi:pancreatic lipase-related protein 2
MLFCSHRAPDYFAESIQSKLGFWGFRCQSYIYYLFGMCKPSSETQALAGEDCRETTKGMFFISTNPSSPYAIGRIIDDAATTAQMKSIAPFPFMSQRNVDPLLKEIDVFGKLEGNFNNLPYSNDDELDNFNFFSVRGSDKLAHNFLDKLRKNMLK